MGARVGGHLRGYRALIRLLSMSTIRGIFGSFVAIGIVTALSACTSGAVDVPTSSPAPTVTAQPTPDVEPVVWPVTLIPVTCDQLVPQPLRDATFGMELPAQAGASNAPGATTQFVTAFENAGGVWCAWELPDDAGNPEDNRIVAAGISPRAGAAAATIAEALDSTSGGTQMGCAAGYCSFLSLVGEYSIHAIVSGLDEGTAGTTPPEVQQIFDSVLEVTESLPDSDTPTWPEDKSEWPTSCEELVDVDALSVALEMSGISHTAGFSYELGNSGGIATLTAGGLVCGFASSGASRFASIRTLPGSAGPFAAAREVALASELSESVQITGLGPSDAYITHSAYTQAIQTLDLNIRGTWMNLTCAEPHGEAALPNGERLIRFAEFLANGE